MKERRILRQRYSGVLEEEDSERLDALVNKHTRKIKFVFIISLFDCQAA